MIKQLKYYFSFVPSRAVGLVFAINSFMFGNWAARIPDVKERLALTESELGLALLGLPIGAVSMMPFMGYLIRKFGSGRMSIILVWLFCFSMILPVLTTNLAWLTLSLVLVGAMHGSTDIAMNAAAAAVEKENKIHIMSTSHGMWSLGSMVGAGVGGFVAELGIGQPLHMLVAALLMSLLCFWIYSPLLKINDETHEGSGFKLPKGPLIGLALITFFILITEGAVADWSAVFIKEIHQGNKFLAGLGYAGFSFSMMLGRFVGDSLLPKFGNRGTMIFCSLLATLGLLVPIFTTDAIMAIIGYTASGFGFSLIIPIIFKAAANIEGIDAGTGLAMVASLGYAGFLFGPPAIGLLSEEIGLLYGMAFVAFLTFLVFIFSLFKRKI